MRKHLLNFAKKNTVFLLLLSFFLIAYCLLGVQKHNRFETGDDLALYDQALWKYSQFKAPYSSFKEAILLTDHFGPILALFSPLYWIWSDPRMLLLAQEFLLVTGAIPVYLLSLKKIKNKLSSLIIVFLFLYFIGIQSAVSADFHLAAITATFLSFTIYFLEIKKWRYFWIFFVLSLLCKEDVPAYLFGISLYAIITKKEYKRGFIGAFVSIAYFYCINNFFIPILQSTPIKFGNLGGKSSGFIRIAFNNPVEFFRNFVYPVVKIRNIFLILFSFGFLPIFSSLFWLTAPFNFLRFFSDPARYGLHFHYTAALAPILAFSMINVMTKFKKQYLKYCFLAIAVIGSFYTNKPNLDPGYPTPPISFVFKRAFWVLPPRNKDYYEMMSLIPLDASVSAQTALLPHLSHRDKIYRFPDNYDSADYVLLAPTESPYPIDWEKYEIIKEELLNNPNYEKIYMTYAGILFSKHR